MIAARAVERCGGILREIEAVKTGPKLSNGADTELPDRIQAGRDAGLSRR